jgi:hypothetical protein
VTWMKFWEEAFQRYHGAEEIDHANVNIQAPYFGAF